MAERRCISKSVYTQRRFLELPLSTRDLYTYLVLHSDIDGVVEAYSVMRIIGATVTDLKLLDERKYVKVLNDDWVTYISQFTEFNTLDGRGMKGSSYRELLLTQIPEAKLTQLREKKKRKKKSDESDVESDNESHGSPMGIPCTTQLNPTQPNSTQYNDDISRIITEYNRIFSQKHKDNPHNRRIIDNALKTITREQARQIIANEHRRYIDEEYTDFFPSIGWMFGVGLAECTARITAPKNKKVKNRFNSFPEQDYGDMAELEKAILEN